MTKLSSTIPDDLHEVLKELSQETGQSVSALAADFIKQGAYAEADRRNNVESYKATRSQKKGNLQRLPSDTDEQRD